MDYFFIYSQKKAYLASTINFIAVLSPPSIIISEKAGIHIKFFPLGATKPLITLKRRNNSFKDKLYYYIKDTSYYIN